MLYFWRKLALMHIIEHYRNEFIDHLKIKTKDKEPTNLYQPINYILNLGGKRIRPVLTLMTTEMFGQDYRKALDAAFALEVFHNFSLVHDDIMDAAPLRRGKATVHEKWDVNTGILSGDAMLINSYQLFESYEKGMFKDLVQLFSKMAIEVCEGQQYDVDFETRDDVSIAEYLKMIEYKTAVLVATAMKMGAVIAGASSISQNAAYDFGKNLGIAFQIQDDYLDAFGDPKTFGKQVGGDIIENKKTFIYLKSLELATPGQVRELEQLFSIQPKDATDKIATIKEVFVASGAVEQTKEEIARFTENAFDVLEYLEIAADKKVLLRKFAEHLMNREV